MKHPISLFFVFLLPFFGTAQISKTIEVALPGSLSSLLLPQEIGTVTNLKVTGTIDARDFRFMRDSMASISVVDFGGARISAYSGTDGTSIKTGTNSYPADEVPTFAFTRTKQNTDNAYLKKVVVSQWAASIGNAALAMCTALDTIALPASIKNIGAMAFMGSSAVMAVHPQNGCYRDTMGMLFDKSLQVLYHCPVSKRGDCVLPTSLDSVGDNAFYNCTLLRSVEFPKSLSRLGSWAFHNCSGLNSLTVNNTPDKISMGEYVFYNVPTDTCILYIPYGTEGLFRNASQWWNFSRMREHSTGLVTNKQSVNLLNNSASEVLYVRSNVLWTIQSDQSWLTLRKVSGPDFDTVYIAATNNASTANRVAHVVLSGEGLEPKTVTVTQSGPELVINNAAGGLASSLKANDRASILMLKLTGSMDARDFTTLNDSLPMLTSIDLSDVHVTAWDDFQANAIPPYAFSNGYSTNWATLSRILLPKSLRSIGPYTFEKCISLKEISIPDSVTTIAWDVFSNCFNLRSVEFGKSVNQIGENAFRYCTDLNTIRLKSEVPIPFSYWAYLFDEVDVTSCVLRVPFGTKASYAEANIWKKFTNIVEEVSGVYAPSAANLSYSDGSSAKVSLLSTVPWTVQSNQSWLQANPASGSGNQILTLTAHANPAMESRSAVLTITTSEFGSRTIQVSQEANPKRILMKAGELSSLLSVSEKKSLTNLVLTGTMDARDFLVLRDSMPLLTSLDLQHVNIVKYQGNNAVSYFNEDNSIPSYAFCNEWNEEYTSSLEKILLPESVTSIGRNAFNKCKKLKSIDLPEKIFNIQREAFLRCSSLERVVFPKGQIVLGDYAFTACERLTDLQFGDSLLFLGENCFSECVALKHVILPESLISIGAGAFNSCTGLLDIIVPKNVVKIDSRAFESCSSLASVTLNEKLQSIGYFSFMNCSSLTEINIPGSVVSIATAAFVSCSSLKKVRVNAVLPSSVLLQEEVFSNYYMKGYTLYVPSQTKVLYQAAPQWRDFGAIVEMEVALKPVVPDALRIYPNPFSNAFSIQGIEAGTTLDLMDVNGRVLLSRTVFGNTRIEVGNLAKGMYLVRILTPEGEVTRKLMKE